MPVPSPKIRTVLIGTGTIAESHMQGIRAWPDRLEIVAAMDPDAARVRAFADRHRIPDVYTDVDRLLAGTRPDLVQIATPPHTHCDLSIRALEAGAWALCEKPLCASLAELDRIEEAEARTGKYCGALFQWRHGSAVPHLRRLIGEGALGRPLVGICHTLWYRGPAYYEVPWRGRWDTELGGPTMGHGIHAMDLLLALLGEWTEVRAAAATLDRAIEVEDVSMAIVTFASGAIASLVNSVLSPRQESYLRLDFQNATVELRHLYEYINRDWTFTTREPDPALLAALHDIPANTFANHAAILGAWLDDMAANRRPFTSGAEARNTLSLLTAIYKSALTAHPVTRASLDRSDPFYAALHGNLKKSLARP